MATVMRLFSRPCLILGRGRRPRARRRRFEWIESLEGRVLLSTITVTSLADSGPGTLRGAIEQANLTPQSSPAPRDTIVFAPSLRGTITLLSELPPLTSAESIEGPGPSVITVERSSAPGTPVFGIFSIPSTVVYSLTISGLTIQGGDLAGSNGAGIYNGGPLFLTDCVVTGNTITGANGQSAEGAGVYNSGVITLNNDTIENNTITTGASSGSAYGAGLFNNNGQFIANQITIQGNAIDGSPQGSGAAGGAGVACIAVEGLSIADSIISDNSIYGGWSGGAQGGGVYNGPSSDGISFVRISNSTISGNSVTNLASQGGQGGGIANEGFVALTNDTVAGNSAVGGNGLAAAGEGGGIMNQTTGFLSIIYCTINGNFVGQGSLAFPNGAAFVSGQGGGIDNLNPLGLGLVDSIVAENNGGELSSLEDIAGAVLPRGILLGLYGIDLPASTNNLIGDGAGMTGITNGYKGNLIGTDASLVNPRLGGLSNNGGPTPTEALLPGSPAINAGIETSPPSLFGNPVPIPTDQRGDPRFSGSMTDIGAYELPPAPNPGGPKVPALPPIVACVKRLGVGGQTTRLVVSFSEALNPETASKRTNYRLVRLVRNNHGGFRVGQVVAIRSVFYDAAAHKARLTPAHALPVRFVYQLEFEGSSAMVSARSAGPAAPSPS